MPEDPIDVLWDQIQIAYAAIIRAQKIMYVRDQEDVTTTKIADSSGNVCSEKGSVAGMGQAGELPVSSGKSTEDTGRHDQQV